MGNQCSTPAPPGKANYDIYVQTSDVHLNAETLNTIHIQFVGDSERTEWHHVENQYFDRTETHTIVAKDVGPPVLLNIEMSKLLITDEWYPDLITVTHNSGVKLKFPIYDWISEKISVARGEGCLPQHVSNEAVAAARTAEVAKNRDVFAWEPADKMLSRQPRYSAGLPPLFARTISRQKDIVHIGLQVLIAGIRERMENAFNKLDSFSDYDNLYQHFESDSHKLTPNYIKNWQRDAVMGRQVLTGIAQWGFHRCREIPSYFDVTNDDVKCFLDGGNSLQDEINAAKIYISDFYELFKEVERNEGLKCANAVALFYANNRDEFVPIAIQLVPGDRDYLFSPNDAKYDWLLAKMHFRCALTNYQQWSSHFAYTHGIAEPFAVSLFQCFPRSHPLYKLMRPHLRTVSITNHEARPILLSTDGAAVVSSSMKAVSLISRSFDKMNIDELVLPKQLKKLGIDSPNLKNYYYREDGLKIWNVLEKYVRGILGLYYKTDQCLVDDYELQNWCRVMAQEGLGWEDGNHRGMPESISSLDKLIEICTAVIFTCTAQHAAVNFGPLDTYKFVPNSPSVMRELPFKKGEATEERLFEVLPTLNMYVSFISVVSALSIFTEDEIYLGEFPDEFFCEEGALACQKTFTEDLRKINDEILARNKNLEVPYIYLLPQRIPNSIAI